MRYQFGDFELATERYELRRNGIVLHVEPLVFDLILLLSRHPGRVVSRDEIVEGVWQGRLVSEARSMAVSNRRGESSEIAVIARVISAR